MTRPAARPEDVLKRMGVVPVPPLATDPERRFRFAANINAQLDVLAQGKARRRNLYLALAAAASFLLVGAGVVRMLETRGTTAGARVAQSTLVSLAGSVELSHAGQAAGVVAGAVPLGRADEIRTASGASAAATLASGARAILGEEASLLVRVADGRHEELELARGAVDVSVPHLAEGGTFAVRTPDALVTVHGTRFRVSVQTSAGHTQTSVGVSEGTVWIEREGRQVVLERGARWSSAPSEGADVAAAVPTAEHETAAASSAGAARGRGAAADVSTLAEENQAYLAAMSAARSGDDRGALVKLDAFLARYGRAQLAQNAEVERFRALERLGRHAEATRMAERYLASYPTGFAAAEARALAAARAP